MATLERAIEIAVLAHKGAFDKAGAPYIVPSITSRTLLLVVILQA